MKSTFILAADSTRARLFTTTSSSSPLHEIETLSNPEGRLHEHDITSDLPGKVNGRVGEGGHAYQDETSAKEQLVTDFARRIAKHLDQARVTHKFKRLFVIAAPSFLGKLRAQFSAPLSSLICFELAKNLTTHSIADIRKHLPEHLAELSEPR
jgi:protein required for attachment to host cells